MTGKTWALQFVRLAVVGTLFLVAQPFVGRPLVAPAQGALTQGPALVGAVMAEDPATGKVILFGGRDGFGNVRSETWLWDGNDWGISAASTLTPRARSHAAMAADPVTGTVVLFGGIGDSAGHASPLSDTWVWDGRDKTWTPQVLTGGPGSGAAAMASDAKSGTVLLYRILQNETWSWDGTAKRWAREQPTNSPPPRRKIGGMTHDGATGTVVLFGGLADNSPRVFSADTWVWDGGAKTWTNRTPTSSPRGRHSSVFAYHPPTGKVVLFGGDWEFRLADTWTWNGATGTWLKEQPLNRPPPRADGDLAHVSRNGQLVLHGGFGVSDSGRPVITQDTWAWSGTNWKRKA